MPFSAIVSPAMLLSSPCTMRSISPRVTDLFIFRYFATESAAFMKMSISLSSPFKKISFPLEDIIRFGYFSL